MVTDSRYDALFQPIQIGAVTAPNRFYQVPHVSGSLFAIRHTLGRNPRGFYGQSAAPHDGLAGYPRCDQLAGGRRPACAPGWI